MGAPNFSRPNASKIFAVLMSQEVEYCQCNNCNTKHFDYEDELETVRGTGECTECVSKDITWDSEYQSPDEWEYDDLTSNLLETFKEKMKATSGNDSNEIAEIKVFDQIGDIDFEARFTITIESGYHDGAQLDFNLQKSVMGNDIEGDVELDDLYQSDLSIGLQTIQLKNINKRFEALITKTQTEIEEILEQYSNPMVCVAQFSNGEAIYQSAK